MAEPRYYSQLELSNRSEDFLNNIPPAVAKKERHQNGDLFLHPATRFLPAFPRIGDLCFSFFLSPQAYNQATLKCNEITVEVIQSVLLVFGLDR